MSKLANICRRVRISPFRKGMGPTYTVTLDDGAPRGSIPFTHWPVGVRISKSEGGKSTVVYNETMGIPGHQSTDSDASVVAAVDWYCHEAAESDPHIEHLTAEAYSRFAPEGR